ANLLGCLIIGVLLGLFWQFPQISAEWRLFLITGFLGSLTTFSSFSSEVVELFFNDKWLNGFCVLMMHLFGCLAMTVLGIWIYKICSQLLS
ncbi:putative fluoride ion transporter CrcB, partial [Haemophilus influenzae]